MKWLRILIKVLCVSVMLAFAILGVLQVALVLVHRSDGVTRRVPSIPIALAVKTSPVPSSPQELYLDLLKRTLTRTQTTDRYILRSTRSGYPETRRLLAALDHLLDAQFEIVQCVPADPDGYLRGGGVHLERRQEDAETMVGTMQLDNVQFCVTDALQRKVPGDVIECGAWRGGVTILMRAVLRAYGDTERKVWVADSFEGLPDANFQFDAHWGGRGQMAVSLEEARGNFARYGLLDEQVRFLKGYFNKTLPTAPITKLSVLRADADLYDSQKDVLEHLYPKLSVGGYMIVDDYYIVGCRRAIDEYRAAHRITEPISQIDGGAVYWQKLR